MRLTLFESLTLVVYSHAFFISKMTWEEVIKNTVAIKTKGENKEPRHAPSENET